MNRVSTRRWQDQWAAPDIQKLRGFPLRSKPLRFWLPVSPSVVQPLRARTTERRIAIRMIAWRFAPHNHADQADIGPQSLRLFRPRGLSATPLGEMPTLRSNMDKI